MEIKQTKQSDRPEGFTQIRSYWFLSLLLVFLIHMASFFIFYWFEMKELESQLIAVSRNIPEYYRLNEGLNSGNPTVELLGDVVVLKSGTIENGESRERRDEKFDEIRINNTEYLAYATNEGYLVAKREDDFNSEIYKFGIILAVLYIVEVVVLVGWWMFFKEKIKELFIIG